MRLLSGSLITDDYIKAEGTAGRMGVRLMAIIAEGDRERGISAAFTGTEEIARNVKPKWNLK